ncbi:MAG: flagellar biosynthetic protein FliQ [Proteobacteria bacterium]|nr:flagellar biosynthetic protein FliQ [Pseudomonadota bacterium]
MSFETVSGILQDTIYTSLLISAPFLVAAIVVGLGISILQVATQINEQALTVVPKIVIVLAIFAGLFPWSMRTMIDFTRRLLFYVAERGGT